MKTVKEIAKELNVTPQTVRNEIERQKLQTSKSKSGKGFVLQDADAERIKKAVFERGEKLRQKQNDKRATKEGGLLLLLQQENEAKAERLRAYERQIDALTAALQRQQENITALTAALQQTTESLRAAQALHAGTIKERLEESERAPVERNGSGEKIPEEIPRRRAWWRFWE